MKTIQLNISDLIFDKVMFFLNNIPKKNIEIITDLHKNKSAPTNNKSIDYMTMSSVDTIIDWQDESEDKIWK